MDGVLNMQGATWVRHTRALAATFHSSNVDRYAGAMHAIATRHAQAWARGIAADAGVLPPVPDRAGGTTVASLPRSATGGPCLIEAVRGIGMEVVMTWGYGIQPQHPLAQRLARQLTKYGAVLAGLGQRPLQLVCSCARLTATGNAIGATVREIVALRRSDPAAINAHVAGGVNGLEAMVAAGLSQSEIAAEVNHVHGAHKAAAFSIAHTLHELCQLPLAGAVVDGVLPISSASGTWWRQRVTREIRRVLGDSGVPSREDLASRLPLTNAILLEARRRHPVSLGVVRQTGAPVTIDGVTLPSGTEVVVLLQALQNLPCFWRDPHHFRPERWLTPTAIADALVAEGATAVSAALVGKSATVALPAVRMRDGTVVALGGDVIGSAVPVLDRTASAGKRSDDSQGSGSDVDGGDGSPASAFSSKLELAQDTTPHATPIAYIPFLTGSRMCAGKVLAEVEMVVVLAAILRCVEVDTRTEYLYHSNGVPVGAGVGTAALANARKALGLTAAGYGEGDGGRGDGGNLVVSVPEAADGAGGVGGVRSGDIVVHRGYVGPVTLLRAPNMYATVDGEVPFTAVA